MKSLTILFAALSLVAVVVSAEAQSLGTVSRTAPGAAMTEAAGGTPEVVAGYNFAAATTCLVFAADGVNIVCVLPPTGGSICSANGTVQTGMLAACQTGNLLAFYVPDPSTGVFTNMVTLIHK
jgi:hypothetical protein